MKKSLPVSCLTHIPKELVRLKRCVGKMVWMVSFVSATEDPEVTATFLGNGNARPAFESAILEVKHHLLRTLAI